MPIKNFKDINIGEIIQRIILEYTIDHTRICEYFKYTSDEVNNIYNSTSLDADTMLKWSKFLEYDLFRIYTQHLILYSPSSSKQKGHESKSSVPKFRKNIYTAEIIEFIVELITTNEKTITEVVNEYGIPKTTVYKWIKKHKL